MTDDIAKAREDDWAKRIAEVALFLSQNGWRGRTIPFETLEMFERHAAQRVKEATAEMQGLIVTHEICNQQMKKALAEKDAEIERLRKHAKQLGDLAEVHADDACTKAIEIERLRKLDAEYGRLESAIIMSDPDFDGDSDHPDCISRLLNSIERRQARIAALEAVAGAAAKKFREYEAIHAAKGTVDGAEKAVANALMAARIEAALEGEKSDG